MLKFFSDFFSRYEMTHYRTVVFIFFLIVIIFGSLLRLVKKYYENKKDQNAVIQINIRLEDQPNIQINNQAHNSALIPGYFIAVAFSIIFLLIAMIVIIRFMGPNLNTISRTMYVNAIMNLYTGFFFPLILVGFNPKLRSHIKSFVHSQ